MAGYSTFSQDSGSHLTQPMFFGDDVAVARYDEIRFPWIDKTTDKQLGFFWRPEEVAVDRDAIDFKEKLNDSERHIFTSNLKYQTLLDSVQGRSPNVALLPIVSLPELETWIETWSFSETIHSRSYTHIIRNIYENPSTVFDSITTDQEIIKRAVAVTEDYDRLINLVGRRVAGLHVDQHEIEDALFRVMVSVNVLEAIRFYVSFACSWSFAERELMEGNAKIIKLIARDEALHLSVTQRILQHWINGKDSEAMQECAMRNFDFIEHAFSMAAQQEKEWAEYLFKDGSMMGLNKDILGQYVEYITNVRIKALGCAPIFDDVKNPIPWINNWLSSDAVQVAPQETEISSYLSGGVNSNVSESDFAGFDL